MKTLTNRALFTRRVTLTAVDAEPGRIEVEDGGVYIRVGDVEIAITSADTDDDDKTHESLVRAHASMRALYDAAGDALDELDAAIKQLGAECIECKGSKGHENDRGTWIDCITCRGRGRTQAAAAA